MPVWLTRCANLNVCMQSCPGPQFCVTGRPCPAGTVDTTAGHCEDLRPATCPAGSTLQRLGSGTNGGSGRVYCILDGQCDRDVAVRHGVAVCLPTGRLLKIPFVMTTVVVIDAAAAPGVAILFWLTGRLCPNTALMLPSTSAWLPGRPWASKAGNLTCDLLRIGNPATNPTGSGGGSACADLPCGTLGGCEELTAGFRCVCSDEDGVIPGGGFDEAGACAVAPQAGAYSGIGSQPTCCA